MTRMGATSRGRRHGGLPRRGVAPPVLAGVLLLGALACVVAADETDAVPIPRAAPSSGALGGIDARDVVWRVDAPRPPGGDRRDILGLGDALPRVAARGLRHTLVWPVGISRGTLPWRPLERMMDPAARAPSLRLMQAVGRRALGFGTLPELFDHLGLARADGRPYAFGEVPWPEGVGAGTPLGAGRVATPWGEGFTFSCATCHTGELFGRPVVGLGNRRARANQVVDLASHVLPFVAGPVLEAVGGADEGDLALLRRAREGMRAVASPPPRVRGLVNAFGLVTATLSRRGDDPWAAREPARAVVHKSAPSAALDMDSKPSVWWTARYKTRWFSDGALVGGNPILANILVNELGRGTDLRPLLAWIESHPDVIAELTALVFACEAPRYEDFLGIEALDVASARRGEAHFLRLCASCHGTYRKGWHEADAAGMSARELVGTTHVDYPWPTRVVDVGTDERRWRGLAALVPLHERLAITRETGLVLEMQRGYVPPPLDGIWARYPYLHNQSVPTLDALLRPAAERPAVFWVGPADDPRTDFDADRVGYPTGEAVPASWREDDEIRQDAAKPGLSNQGHDAWLVAPDGTPALDEAARADLIEFLKTL